MKEKQTLKDLYHLYLNNQCSEEELTLFFEALNQDGDIEILTLMSASWDNTHTLPDVDLVPDFLPVEAKQVKLNRFPSEGINWRKFVAAVAAILVLAFGVYFFRSTLVNFVNPVHQQETWSANGERKKIQLADGTRVWLSPNSKLNYPDKFNAKQRIVNLDGEAFFEVAHNAEHPFIIKTGVVNTVVLGTSFNVSAYAKQPTISVTLVTGKVAVALEAKNKTYTMLLPNQQLIVDKKNKKLSKVDFPDAGSFLNRRLGKYEYKGTRLRQVVQDLTSQYNIEIQLNSSLSDKVFYGNLDMTNTVSQTLNKLCLIMEVTYEKKGDRYVIIK